jgi:hypothetical protein
MKFYYDNRQFDLTSVLIDDGTESFVFEGDQIISSERTFTILDKNGIYTPFVPDGILSKPYRNKTVELVDDLGNVIFYGLVQDIKELEDGTYVQIITNDALGALMSIPVNVTDIETYAGFLVNGFHGKGSTIIVVDTGTLAIPENTLVSFDQNYLPSYKINKVNNVSGVTKTIELDRPLEQDLSDNQSVFVSIPIEDTPANILKTQLATAIAALGVSDKIILDSNSFLSASNAQAGKELWVFIRPENGILLGEFIGYIIRSTETFLIQENGTIYCQFGSEWNGTNPGVKITDSEILSGSLNKVTIKEKLLYGYVVPYNENGIVKDIRYFLGDNSPILKETLATKPFKPFPLKTQNLFDYNILYASYDSAFFYAEKIFNYWKYERERYSISLKPYFSGSLSRIPIRQFQQILLDHTLNDYQELVNEPFRIISFEQTEEAFFSQVIIERNNYPSPGKVLVQ